MRKALIIFGNYDFLLLSRIKLKSSSKHGELSIILNLQTAPKYLGMCSVFSKPSFLDSHVVLMQIRTMFNVLIIQRSLFDRSQSSETFIERRSFIFQEEQIKIHETYLIFTSKQNSIQSILLLTFIQLPFHPRHLNIYHFSFGSKPSQTNAFKNGNLNRANHAVRTQAPPTALIFLSAILLKNLALTTTGCAGRNPFPRTLKKPALVTSMTGTLSLVAAQKVRACSVRRVQTLSMLMEGKWRWLRWRLKTRMPFLPKKPGWYLSMAVRLCCRPPALPRPPECFRCLPTLPPPQLTDPLSFLILRNLAVINYGNIILINKYSFVLLSLPPSPTPCALPPTVRTGPAGAVNSHYNSLIIKSYDVNRQGGEDGRGGVGLRRERLHRREGQPGGLEGRADRGEVRALATIQGALRRMAQQVRRDLQIQQPQAQALPHPRRRIHRTAAKPRHPRLEVSAARTRRAPRTTPRLRGSSRGALASRGQPLPARDQPVPARPQLPLRRLPDDLEVRHGRGTAQRARLLCAQHQVPHPLPQGTQQPLRLVPLRHRQPTGNRTTDPQAGLPALLLRDLRRRIHHLGKLPAPRRLLQGQFRTPQGVLPGQLEAGTQTHLPDVHHQLLHPAGRHGGHRQNRRPTPRPGRARALPLPPVTHHTLQRALLPREHCRPRNSHPEDHQDRREQPHQAPRPPLQRPPQAPRQQLPQRSGELDPGDGVPGAYNGVEHRAVAVAVAEDDRMPVLRAQAEGDRADQRDLREERLHPEDGVLPRVDGAHAAARDPLHQQRQPGVHQEGLRTRQVPQHQEQHHRPGRPPHLACKARQARDHRQGNLHPHLRTAPLRKRGLEEDRTLQKSSQHPSGSLGRGLHQNDQGVLRELLRHRPA